MVCRQLFLLEKKGRFGRFPVSPYGKALSDAFWCRSKRLFCTEPSNSPVPFSSCKIPSGNAYIWLRTFSAFILPKKKARRRSPGPNSYRSKSSSRFVEFPPARNPIQQNDGRLPGAVGLLRLATITPRPSFWLPPGMVRGDPLCTVIPGDPAMINQFATIVETLVRSSLDSSLGAEPGIVPDIHRAFVVRDFPGFVDCLHVLRG